MARALQSFEKIQANFAPQGQRPTCEKMNALLQSFLSLHNGPKVHKSCNCLFRRACSSHKHPPRANTEQCSREPSHGNRGRRPTAATSPIKVLTTVTMDNVDHAPHAWGTACRRTGATLWCRESCTGSRVLHCKLAELQILSFRKRHALHGR